MSLFKFGIVNKTYDKDYYWSLYLYMSFERYVKYVPFFIIAPEESIGKLINIFQEAMRDGKINMFPFFLTDNMILDAAHELVPNNFTGWETQQVIKLSFSLSSYCETYMTVDSAVLFTSQFNWKEILFQQGMICTGAKEENRNELKERIIKHGEVSVIKGNSVFLNDALDFIDETFGNISQDTFWHVSSNGFFNSINVVAMRNYLRSKQVINPAAGFADIISLVPCEFAWYGSYMANCNKEEFNILNPNIFAPCVNKNEYDDYLSLKCKVSPPFYGILFHNQNEYNADPDSAFCALIVDSI